MQYLISWINQYKNILFAKNVSWYFDRMYYNLLKLQMTNILII